MLGKQLPNVVLPRVVVGIVLCGDRGANGNLAGLGGVAEDSTQHCDPYSFWTKDHSAFGITLEARQSVVHKTISTVVQFIVIKRGNRVR